MKKTRKLLLTALLAATSFSAGAQNGLLRDARLEWKDLDNVSKYEIEISKSPRMDKLVLKKELTQNSLKLKLEGGQYFFRLRAFDDDNIVGAWSPVQGFWIQGQGPQLIFPKDGDRFAELQNKSYIDLQWKGSTPNSTYKIEISDDQGVVLSRNSSESHLKWKPTDEGTYSYRVGYDTLLGTEWSEKRSFEILPKAVASIENRKSNAGSFSPLQFRLGLLYEKQSGGAYSYSPQGSWNPEIGLSKNTKLNAHLGLALLKKNSKSTFTVIDYLIGVEFGISRLSLGLAAGFQSWSGFGTYPLGELGLSYKFHGFFERIYLSTGYLRQDSNDSAMVVKVGAGFKFGEDSRRQVIP